MVDRIPEGITRGHVRAAIEDLDAGRDHAFGESTKFHLVYEGRRYPPKAVLGLAAQHRSGEQYFPRDFSGGKDAKCFRIQIGLGFVIEDKLPDTEPTSDPNELKRRARALRGRRGREKPWWNRTRAEARLGRVRRRAESGRLPGRSAPTGAPRDASCSVRSAVRSVGVR